MKKVTLSVAAVLSCLFLVLSCRSVSNGPEAAGGEKWGTLNWILLLERASSAEEMYPAALRSIDQGERMARESGDQLMEQVFRFDRGYVQTRTDNPAEGLATMQEVVAWLRVQPQAGIRNPKDILSVCYGYLVDAYSSLGRYDEAIDASMLRLDLLTRLYASGGDPSYLDQQYSRTSTELARLLALTGQADSLTVAQADFLSAADSLEDDPLSQATRYISLYHLRQQEEAVAWKEAEARRNLMIALAAILALLVVCILLFMVIKYSRELSGKNRQLVRNLEQMDAYRQEVARLKDEAVEQEERKRTAVRISDAELAGRLDAMMETEQLYLQSDLNMKTLSQRLAVPQSRLETLFRNLPDSESFSDYLNRKRLLYACNLLKENPYLKIAAVSEAAGFTSLSVFQRYFKKEMGMTAAEYREAVRS